MNIGDRNSALVRGFVKLKKIQKSEKNPEAGGWVMSPLGFFVCVFCVVFMIPNLLKKKKNWMGGA